MAGKIDSEEIKRLFCHPHTVRGEKKRMEEEREFVEVTEKLKKKTIKETR